ncbi:MAG: dienelactone hydrolase family protein [Dehalococcoidia bacterium]
MEIPEALLRHLYAYDRTLPLAPTSEREASTERRPDLVRERVTFGSTHDQRVVATLTYPATGGPFAAVIAQHGSTGLGRHVMTTSRPELPEPVADRWAATGMMVASVDAYGFGSRETPDNRGRLTPDRPDLIFRTRDQRMQAVQDLMRTVDYLQSRDDVRGDAVGYYGVSMGCRIGVPFVALDRRVRAAALFIGGSGPYSRFVTDGTPFADLEADEALAWALTDPLTFAPLTGHVPKFVVNGTRDTTVGGREPAERLHGALAGATEVHWYEGDHAEYPPRLVAAARDFLAGHLQVSP